MAMEAYRVDDQQYFMEQDIGYYLDEFIEAHNGEMPSRRNCDYYPEGCRRCKLASRCDNL